jgi:hypothetical protein
MLATRRELFKSGFASAAAAALPDIKPHLSHRVATTAELRANYAKCDAAAALPVFKRELFPDPVILESVELLHYKKSWLCRVRSKDGAEGIAISNSQQMEVLFPIFVKRIAPYFLGKDARDLESLMEEVTVYESNYKATGLAIFVPMATVEFAILDMFGKMSKRPIGLLISDKIYNPRSLSTRPMENGTSPPKRRLNIFSAMLKSQRRRRSSLSLAAGCRIRRRR